jgi:hypothetical protein
VASSRSKKGPGGPLSGLPVNTRPVGPRPPCNSSRGFEEQDGICVCMPGTASVASSVLRSQLCERSSRCCEQVQARIATAAGALSSHMAAVRLLLCSHACRCDTSLAATVGYCTASPL